ncbi:flagellar hook assembly protein FlgD [Pseudovibrio sp. SPO723]|uniref:flagellar hook assembly protein FlgD n=1 Tax=Nesiotobacter zosterae TaxID=392721 RepID=UPI0029C3B3DC|nr:flagellar hook assembly protein FlgD [Pseudovibrio sp. SPO723]MDX5593681.1 flagellar hook assembly protein FlgD [Pseudovibrio sp. SPO723]
MTVSSVTGTQSQAAQATAQTTAQMDREDAYLDYQAFLKLFMESLKNQDPTEPMDTAEYMGQMAQFSAVEQSTLMNQNLESMLKQSSIDQASGLIGMTVTTNDGKVSGIVESVQVTSEGNVAILEGGTAVLVQPGVTISKPTES